MVVNNKGQHICRPGGCGFCLQLNNVVFLKQKKSKPKPKPNNLLLTKLKPNICNIKLLHLNTHAFLLGGQFTHII